MLDEAWKNTNTGKSYNLGDFRSVVEMLKGSPIAISKYMRDNFKNLGVCRSNGMGMHIADSYIFQPAEKTFKEKGGDPTDLAMFGLTLLLEDKEWSYDNFEVNKNNAACVLTSFKLTYFGEKTSESTHTEGSATTLYIQNGSFYIIDTGYRGNCNISGPFKTIDDAAYATFPGFGYTDYFNLKTYDKYELLNIVNKYNKK